MQQPLISEISKRRKLALLKKHLSPGDLILEVGAGSEWFSQQLRKNGYNVTTLDILAPANIVGDINQWKNIGIRENSFDEVIALEVIEHVDCLAALSSVCKIGGLIMLSSPHPSYDWIMKIFEHLNLNQKRTSPHSNLTDFKEIQLPSIVRHRPLLIHQVAIFKNEKLSP